MPTPRRSASLTSAETLQVNAVGITFAVRQSTNYKVPCATLVNRVRLANVDYNPIPSPVPEMRKPMMLSFRRRSEEEGVVLVTVLLVTFVLLILVAGTMAYAVGSQPLSRRDQDWNAALSSAEAGLDDYLFRLNQNDQYYLYGAAPTTLACGTGLTLAAPPDGNLAFSQWVPVPGATSNATFTYRVDTSCLVAGRGHRMVDREGRERHPDGPGDPAPPRVHRLPVLHRLRDEGPGRVHPSPTTTRPPRRRPTARCTATRAGTSGRTDFPGDTDGNTCMDINFVSGDTINGPLHSNDAILICGSPTFNGKVTTSWQGAGTPIKRYRRTPAALRAANPTFANSGDPKYADPLTMPPSNTAIKVKADGALGGAGMSVHRPDVHHAERRRDDDGREPVHQAAATHEQLRGRDVASPSPKPARERCDLRPERPGGPDRPELHGRLPHVDRRSARGRPPSSTRSATRSDDDITTVRVQERRCVPQGSAEGPSHDRRGQQHRHHRQPHVPTVARAAPTCWAWSRTTTSRSTTRSDDCGSAPPCDRTGAKVNGYYNLDDVAGGLDGLANNPTVNAAILSVNHSFRVQNYQYGDNNPWGPITINGAIAQKYRGTVGTTAGPAGTSRTTPTTSG